MKVVRHYCDLCGELIVGSVREITLSWSANPKERAFDYTGIEGEIELCENCKGTVDNFIYGMFVGGHTKNGKDKSDAGKN